MKNHTKLEEEIEEIKLPNQTAINMTPRKERSELGQKTINLNSKKLSLSENLSRSQIIPAKSIDLYSSKQYIIYPTETKIIPTKSGPIKPIKNAKIPVKKKNKIKVKEKKEELDHISLNELSDEEEEKPIIIESKRRHRSHSINNNEVKSFKYCGKKRKNPEKRKERIKSYNEKKNNGNDVENKKKKKITNSNLGKNIINLMDENNNDDKRRNNIVEKKILTNLVKKEGLLKIYDLLSISPLNRKNPLERELDDIILNLGLLRTTILLFKIQLEQSITNNNSTSNNKDINIEKFIPTINNIMNSSKNNNTKKNVPIANSNKDENMVNILITDDEVEEGKKPKIKICYDNEKRIRSAPKPNNSKDIKISNNKDIKSIQKKKDNLPCTKMISIKKEELNKELEISIHFQKDKDGKIFKYCKSHLCSNKGDPFYTFYCADRKCGAKAYYYIKSMKFENITNHKLPHSEHCYIRNMNRNMNIEGKYNPIIEEFIKRNYHEAQVFLKNNGAQLVKWYDQ